MLTIRSLNVSYGDSQVLWDVHLDVPPGQVVSLGSEWCGQDHAVKEHHGSADPAVGSIAFHGQELTKLSSDERDGVALAMYHRADIFPDLTVHENLRIGLVARGVSNGTIPDEIFSASPCSRRCSPEKADC
jgi:ABC-type branched-subunit amino acid transport system ATPase component